MDIKIDNFRITADDMQYILSEKKTRGTKAKVPGEEVWVPFAWDKTLEHIISIIITLRLRRSDVTTLKETVQLLKVIREDVRGYFE